MSVIMIRKKLLISLGIFPLLLSGCGKKDKTSDDIVVDNRSDDVVILYTTDVHCGVEDNLGYAKVAAYKKEMLKSYKYVTLVDAGDFIQGGLIGSFSQGKSIVNIMNKMNYEISAIGNHEFDYGIDALSEVIGDFNGDFIACNLSYIGNKENKISNVKPYVIKEYGDLKIGFVGVTTPLTVSESTPSIFREDGQFAYSFSGETIDGYYKCIQDNIDAVNKVADYTVLITHCGNDEHASPYGSRDIIANTTGYLAVMDGHSHFDVNWEILKDKTGKDVPLCDAGTQLKEFGKLIIHKNGTIDTDFISNYEHSDEEVANYIDQMKEATDEIANRVVAQSDIDLSIYDENGIRKVRSRETPIGNLIADAFKEVAHADIGFTNGGGVRSDISKGDVTFGDIFAVLPFGNYMMVKSVKGEEILDYLEHCSQYTEKEYEKDGKAIGEFGGFAVPSGLRYTIDTSIESHVVMDANGNFIKVDGERRVKNVQVLENDTYVNIDENKMYSVSSISYILEEGGNGANMFISDEEIETEIRIDYEVVIEYLTDYLTGNLAEKYSSTEGRINVI